MQTRGVTLWLTGFSGAGKTTIAKGLESEFKARNCLVEVLDGDLIRSYLSPDLGFSKKDRDTNVRRIGFVATLLSKNGVVAITSVISPYRAIRDEIRMMSKNFIEVYVNAPLEVCEDRDVKGLYAMARSGKIKGFTGIDDPYEEPINPEIVCYTAKESIEESITKVVTELERLNYIPVQNKEDKNLHIQAFLSKIKIADKNSLVQGVIHQETGGKNTYLDSLLSCSKLFSYC